MNTNNLIKCCDCGQQYRPGKPHKCRPLHEVVGLKSRSTPDRTLPNGSPYKGNALDERLVGPSGMPGTGLTRREVISRAEDWWDSRGRHLIRKQLVTASAMEDRIISGLLEGRPWSELSAEECVRVGEAWYVNYWLPEQQGAAEEGQAQHIQTH